MAASSRPPCFELRPSAVAGTGAFATRPIRKGTRIIEYLGERISHAEADRRFQRDDGTGSPHVVMFVVDGRTVIDAAVGGNEAQFINHSCEPNCEAVIEKRRIFIEAIRDIAPGEELNYDYELTRENEDDAEEEKRYPCRCGAPRCRGTLLGPKEEPKKARPRSTAASRSTRRGSAGQRSSASSASSRGRKKGAVRGTTAGRHSTHLRQTRASSRADGARPAGPRRGRGAARAR